MPYLAQFVPTFLINGDWSHPDRAKWGIMHRMWRRELMDELGRLAMAFRGTRDPEERQRIAKEYAAAWDGEMLNSDEYLAPEDQLPDELMPKARVDVIVTDMGNGGAFCSECGCDLDHGDPRNEIPFSCPKCWRKLEGYNPPYINMGGSDF